ncbi:MAG TPA: hypothetical protein VIJ19_00015, partial [Opitutaceae bacterium]
MPALALLLAVCAPAAASDSLNAPVPLAPPQPAVTPGEASLAFVSAERAQSLGFPSTAVTLYRAMLASPNADTSRLTLLLSSALLDDGDVAGAARVLDSYTGSRGAGWHLREGLVFAHQGRLDQARGELASAHFEELSSAERGWHYFLQGMLSDASNETVRAAGFYAQAASSAISDLQRARFLLAEEQVRLRSGAVTEDQLSADKKNADKFQGQKIGYGFVREYAIALNAVGRKTQAIDV